MKTAASTALDACNKARLSQPAATSAPSLTAIVPGQTSLTRAVAPDLAGSNVQGERNKSQAEGSAAVASTSQQHLRQQQPSQVYIQQQTLPGADAFAAAANSLQSGDVSNTASSQSKINVQRQNAQQLPQPSASVQGHFDVKVASQALTKLGAAQRLATLKQPPLKKEKIQCLFCTKPARLICHHKLCKKCCNERHPNDCKAHDTGPIAEKDKPKQARVHALAATPTHSTAVTPPSKPRSPVIEASQPDSPALRGISPGPNAVNLSEAAHIYHQEMQENAQWQAAAYIFVDLEQHDAADQAMHRYNTTEHLLYHLCQSTAANRWLAPDAGDRPQSLLQTGPDGTVHHSAVPQQQTGGDSGDSQQSAAEVQTKTEIAAAGTSSESMALDDDSRPSPAHNTDLSACRTFVLL